MVERLRSRQLPPGYLEEEWVARDIPMEGVVHGVVKRRTGSKGDVGPNEVTALLLIGPKYNRHRKRLMFSGDLAEEATRLTSGDKIAVVGDIHIRDYPTKSGRPRRHSEFRVNRMHRL